MKRYTCVSTKKIIILPAKYYKLKLLLAAYDIFVEMHYNQDILPPKPCQKVKYMWRWDFKKPLKKTNIISYGIEGYWSKYMKQRRYQGSNTLSISSLLWKKRPIFKPWKITNFKPKKLKKSKEIALSVSLNEPFKRIMEVDFNRGVIWDFRTILDEHNVSIFDDDRIGPRRLVIKKERIKTNTKSRRVTKAKLELDLKKLSQKSPRAWLRRKLEFSLKQVPIRYRTIIQRDRIAEWGWPYIGPLKVLKETKYFSKNKLKTILSLDYILQLYKVKSSKINTIISKKLKAYCWTLNENKSVVLEYTKLNQQLASLNKLCNKFIKTKQQEFIPVNKLINKVKYKSFPLDCYIFSLAIAYARIRGDNFHCLTSFSYNEKNNGLSTRLERFYKHNSKLRDIVENKKNILFKTNHEVYSKYHNDVLIKKEFMKNMSTRFKGNKEKELEWLNSPFLNNGAPLFKKENNVFNKYHKVFVVLRGYNAELRVIISEIKKQKSVWNWKAMDFKTKYEFLINRKKAGKFHHQRPHETRAHEAFIYKYEQYLKQPQTYTSRKWYDDMQQKIQNYYLKNGYNLW